MGNRGNNQPGGLVNIALAILGIVAVMGLAVAYLRASRQSRTALTRRTGKGLIRRVGLMALVGIIENDAARKVLVTALKAIARRS